MWNIPRTDRTSNELENTDRLIYEPFINILFTFSQNVIVDRFNNKYDG